MQGIWVRGGTHTKERFPVIEWLTATEAGAYLKVRPRTVLKWVKEGRIPGHALSGSERIT